MDQNHCSKTLLIILEHISLSLHYKHCEQFLYQTTFHTAAKRINLNCKFDHSSPGLKSLSIPLCLVNKVQTPCSYTLLPHFSIFGTLFYISHHEHSPKRTHFLYLGHSCPLANSLPASLNLFLNLYAASPSLNCTPWLGMLIEHPTYDHSEVHLNFFYLVLKLLIYLVFCT